jgi:predicted MPP superfamily phosphohydrolase
MVLFAIVALTVVAVTHLWLALRLSAPFEAPWSWLLMAAMAASAVMLPLTMILTRTGGESETARLVGVFGFVLMGFWSILVGAMLAWELGRLLLWIWDLGAGLLAPQLASAAWWPDLPWLHRGGVLAVLALTLITGTLGVVGGRAAPKVERVTLAVPGLHPDLAGLRIVQISDIHVGPTVRRPFVASMVREVNALEPDLVALTGDLVDGSVAALREHTAPLADLKAPLGTYFVTGNHEYYSGVFAWLEEVERLGMVSLVNEHRLVERGAARVAVAGITDERAGSLVPSHRPDAVAALHGAPRDALKLMLAHQPRSAPAAAEAGAEVILSGHTHGGQYAPWVWAIHLVEPFIAGTYRLGEAWLVVNRGTGTWGPPLRLGSYQEITLIELQVAG